MTHSPWHLTSPNQDVPSSRFGPMTVQNIGEGSGLHDLGTYFMTFVETGASEPWQLRYEEALYVISGELDLVVEEGDRTSRLRSHTGDVIAMRRGAVVRYQGVVGTRLFACITPLNWKDIE